MNRSYIRAAQSCVVILLSAIISGTLPAAGLEGNATLARTIAAEGMVLLENNGVLPLPVDTQVSVFGINQIDYIAVGSGSGHVDAPYTVGLLQGLRNNGSVRVNEDLARVYEAYHAGAFAKAAGGPRPPGPPGAGQAGIDEMQVSEATIRQAADTSDVAIFTLSRLSGEGADRKPDKGDYYLSGVEERLLKDLRKHFGKLVVVLNIAGVIDMDWVDTFKPDAVLLGWLGGMEGGNAMADILSGVVNPSGKLTDTFALDYDDYPSSANFGGFVDGYETVVADGSEVDYWGMIPNHKAPKMGQAYARPVNNRYFVEYEEGIYVGYRYFETFGVPVRYPFGFGLSYTTFEIAGKGIEVADGRLAVAVEVRNSGKRAGKEVVQVYYAAPSGRLETPSRQLVAYAKTDLLQPGQSQVLKLRYRLSDMAAYDESRAAYVLQQGSYGILVGNSVKNLAPAGEHRVPEDIVTEQLKNELQLAEGVSLTTLSRGDPERTAPSTPPMRAKPDQSGPPGPMERAALEFDNGEPGDATIRLIDVYQGRAPLQDFLHQMTDLELTALIVGPGMGSNESIFGPFSSTVPGSAGQLVTLERLGIPSVILADGPAGARLAEPTTAFPVGTLVASTWNDDLATELGKAVGREAIANGVDIWLAPALNIHRNPLCGRNFEYYSEDPLISGSMAAAVSRGVQSEGVGVTLKHFVANNQESNRFDGVDTVATERTLREIYLKGFEIAVKSSNPWVMMTSYNSVNGVYTAARRDLNTDILRGEWGFDGFVVTDWEGDGIYTLESLAAGNNLFMPGFPGQIAYVLKAVGDGWVSREQLETAAFDLLRIAMRTPSFARYYGLPQGSNNPYVAPRPWLEVGRGSVGG